MKFFPSSVALRLTIWFLLLSILPLAVTAVFVRRNVVNTFERLTMSAQQAQAQVNAGYLMEVGAMGDDIALHVAQSQPAQGVHFVVDDAGTVLFHPDHRLLGASLADLYSLQTAQLILLQPSGSLVDELGYIVGFHHFPDRGWVDVVAVSSDAFSNEIASLTRTSAIQLAVSLLFVALSGGVVIWFVVGGPLRQLTQAAEALGRGDLSVKIDADQLDDELAVLAQTISQTQSEMRILISGLEGQVSELNLAYGSLRESEDRFRTIFDSINDSVLVLDAATFAVWDVNNKFEDMFGYSMTDLGSLTVRDLVSNVPGYQYKDLRRKLRAVKRSGSQVFEWYARRKNGSFFWVEIGMRVVYLGKDRPSLVIVVRDIDQRKRSQQVQVANYRVVNVAQSKPTMYEFFAAVHQIVQTFAPAPNLQVALYRGDDPEMYYPYHLDAHEIWPRTQKELDQFLMDEMRGSDDVLLVNQQNMPPALNDHVDTLPFVQWLGLPLNTAGGRLGILVFKYYQGDDLPCESDVDYLAMFAGQVAAALERKQADDALRESEARWRTLMQSAPQVILTLNRFGKVLFSNKPLPEQFDAFEDESLFLYFLPGDSDDEKRAILQRVFGERVTLDFEFKMENASGQLAWFSASLAPVIDRGNIEFAILNAVDITTRKTAEDQVLALNEQLEERVRQRTSMLEAANHELESFSYSISHDLRAPLRAINGFARILHDELENGNTENYLRYLSLIRDNAQQMGALIDDLLSFSRLGRQAVRMIVVSHDELVQQVLFGLDEEISQRGVEISVAQLPGCAGDPSLLKQVWVNLLSNALKFTRRRAHPRIEIFSEENAGQVTYCVRDNGIGFDMKYVDKLFGVFQRLHRPEDFEGTGVGLAIVHRIIDRHGGRVWVESAPDQGCTFYFSLPSQIAVGDEEISKL